ncbi:MAG: putative ABC transport system permease protein [Rhodothermales bacterium]|jgi:putative ABC transport system permease protein
MNGFRLPKYSARFASWLLNDRGETALGDFQEYYSIVAEESGSSAAVWKFRIQVLTMTPGRLAEKTRQGLVMLMNYLTLAVRHFRKQRVASTINVFGLSVAVACCITVFLFLNGYMNMNAEHVNGDRTYLIEQVMDRDGAQEVYGQSPMPLGPALVEDLAAVEQSVRVSGKGAVVYVDDKPFEEWVMFVEPAFMDMFSFPMASGSASALLDPDQVILGEKEAKRLFGNEPAVGRELSIVLTNGRNISATVAAVAERFATSAGVRFTMLMNLDRIADETYGDWKADAGATFVMLQPGASRDEVDSALVRYVAVHNAGDAENPVEAFRLDNIQDPNPKAWDVRNRIIDAPNPVFILMLLAIPLFMLALSCFNYINISLGAAGRRLREIGIRKVVGGSRSQLVLQFLGENLFLCFLSLLLGIAVAFFLLIPLFNSILVNQIVFVAADLKPLVLFLLALLVLVGLLSGSYPAFYVTSFRPVQVLRQSIGLGRKNWLTSTLLTAQFALAFLTVIIGVYLTMNGQYMLSQEWGYNPAGVVSVRVGSDAEAAVVRDMVSQRANVVSVTSSVDQVGVATGRAEVTVRGEEINSYRFAVGANYTETMGLSIETGRGFNDDFTGDQLNSVLVNEAFVRKQGWETPLSETIRMDGSDRNVVGVVGDVLVFPMQSDLPVIFSRSAESEARFITMRIDGVGPREMIAVLRASWKERFPDRPFDALIQSEAFDANLQSYGNVVQAFGYLAALALAIACLGLFGLASQNMAQQLKDISVRKVLGASVSHLMLIVNRRFLLMLFIAAAIATAITIAGFAALTSIPTWEIRHLPLGPGLFAVAYAVVLSTAAIAAGSQARSLVKADPAVVLRSD